MDVTFRSLHVISLKVLHHHHVALVARISLTLSRHSSLSFITLGRSSRQHPVSSHSCWMYVRAGRPAFARPCVGVHKSTSLMSSSLLLQQCPTCLARLTWIVFVIGGRWPYSWCLVGCCRQDLFKIARSIVEIDPLFVSCLNNLRKISFVIYLYTKDLLNLSNYEFGTFSYVSQNVNYSTVICRKNENKFSIEDLRGLFFVSTIAYMSNNLSI